MKAVLVYRERHGLKQIVLCTLMLTVKEIKNRRLVWQIFRF